MSHWKTLIEGAPAQRKDWPEPVKTNGRQLRPDHRQKPKAAPLFIASAALNYDTLCDCGSRFGMHRVGNHACPNQNWRPGNGQPQWLSRNWTRA